MDGTRAIVVGGLVVVGGGGGFVVPKGYSEHLCR